MAGRGNQQQQGMAGPSNGPPQQRMNHGGQLYNGTYAQPGQAPQQPPMWSSAAPTQPQFGNMGMMQNMQQPQMARQPTNNYNLTYNQPMTQAQTQPQGALLEPTAPSADTAQKPAMPDPVVTPPKTAQPAGSNVTGALNAAQNQVQNPLAPTPTTYMAPPPTAYKPPPVGEPPAYTPPPPAYTPPQAATARPSGEQAVNGIVPRPEGTPDYMRTDDYRNAGTNHSGGIGGLLQNMQDEISPTDFNLSPRAPTMNQGQQNLVNMGIDPMIARLYGSRG